MKYGEKIKSARQAAELTQTQLAEKVGVSRQTIALYEANKRIPKNAGIIIALAQALGVSTEYFMSSEELEKMKAQDAFLEAAGKKYGSRGKAQAQMILDQTSALFAGGELEEADKEAFFQTMTEIYFDAKKTAQKYSSTPKNGRDN